MKRNYDIPIAVRSLLSDKIRIGGLICPFDKKTVGKVDGMYEVVEKTAFRNAPKTLPVFLDHVESVSTLLGQADIAVESSRGLYFELEMEKEAQSTRLATLAEKSLLSTSMAFSWRDTKYSVKNGIRHLEKVKIENISIVTKPAYPDTVISIRELERQKNLQQFIELLDVF